MEDEVVVVVVKGFGCAAARAKRFGIGVWGCVGELDVGGEDIVAWGGLAGVLPCCSCG